MAYPYSRAVRRRRAAQRARVRRQRAQIIEQYAMEDEELRARLEAMTLSQLIVWSQRTH